MENYIPMSTVHNHSNIARHVVNTLVIAKLERHVPKFEAQIVERDHLNSHT